MRKKMAMLASVAQILSATKVAARNTIFSLPRIMKVNANSLPAAIATEANARMPQAKARAREMIWFPKYERFRLNPQMRLKATSRGTKTPVDVMSKITKEAILTRWRVFTRD